MSMPGGSSHPRRHQRVEALRVHHATPRIGRDYARHERAGSLVVAIADAVGHRDRHETRNGEAAALFGWPPPPAQTPTSPASRGGRAAVTASPRSTTNREPTCARPKSESRHAEPHAESTRRGHACRRTVTRGCAAVLLLFVGQFARLATPPFAPPRDSSGARPAGAKMGQATLESVSDVSRCSRPGPRLRDEPKLDGLAHALQCAPSWRAEHPMTGALGHRLVHESPLALSRRPHRSRPARAESWSRYAARACALVRWHVVAKRYLVTRIPSTAAG